MTGIQSYPEAVGSFLAAYRKKNRLTLEAVARAGHEYGASWGIASIRNIEAGKAALTVPALIMLALSLRKLTGKSLTLSDLTGEASSISLGAPEALPVTRTWLTGVMAGNAIELHPGDRTHTAKQRAEIDEQEEEESFRQSDETLSRNLTHTDDADVVAAMLDASQEPPEPPEESEESADDERASLAETRAAEKLEIDPHELKWRAMKLFGQSLEQESLERVGKDASPQKRGGATRTIIEEIRGEMRNEA